LNKRKADDFRQPSDDDDVEATSAQPAASKPAATASKKTKLTLLNGKKGNFAKSSSSQTEAGDAASIEVAGDGEPVHSAKKRRKRRKNNQVGVPHQGPHIKRATLRQS
jgi:hypothetical protein